MKRSIIAAAGAVVLVIARPVHAQSSPPLNVEVGAVMGIIAQPYVTVGTGPAPWLVRVSGGGSDHDCMGVQVNVGRTFRDVENAKHSLSLMWAGYRNGCWYGPYSKSRQRGEYTGVAYDFQAKSFFIEVGTAFGAPNPTLVEIGDPLLRHVYGQIGYVHRFGKKYID